ncbi:flagellin [Gynuella sp.]|uniref:flagellin N-terminal helical domain-containing protein n=1 Tax=Gynuella sp. TaxID=2969146 RepID=UPI003D1512DA
MPQIINTNIASLTAQRNLNTSQSANQTALQRLSSGLRINSAKDDAAGLAISTKFDSQISGLGVAISNAGDGVSLAQTAEGALGAMTENLQRIRELAVQSSNATNSEDDRVALQAEVEQLVEEISRTAEETTFNGRNLLDGTFSGVFQIGANAGDTIDVNISELTAGKLGSSATAGVSAIGSSNAISNGDLTINGVAVSASSASDDESSTYNKAASAISKVAAINDVSEQTGVSAVVNENEVAGTSMTATAMSGTISLNGVEIDIQTTNDASSSRASVVEAINAVSEQTGIVASDSGSDSGGVTLTAEDGRNITLGFDNLTNTAGSSFVETAGSSNYTLNEIAAATGLAVGGQYNSLDTGAAANSFTTSTASVTNNAAQASAGTYEGGYTLIANAGTDEIVIEGGNDTGRGDLANAGLVAGTYTSSTAALVSNKQAVSYSETALEVTASATQILDADRIAAAATNDAAAVTAFSFSVDGSEVSSGVTSAAALSLGEVTDELNTQLAADGVTDVVAYEEFTVELSMSAGNLAQGDTFDLETETTATTVSAVVGDVASGNGLAELADSINSTDYSSIGLEVSAELNSAGDGVVLTVHNYSGEAVSIGGTTADAGNLQGAYVKPDGTSVAAEDIETADLFVTGNLAISTSSNKQVSVTLSDATQVSKLFNSDTVASETLTAAATVNGLDDGDLVLNGVGVPAPSGAEDTASATYASDGSTSIYSSDKSLSAISVAAAINSVSEETGVTAEVNATQVTGGDGTAAATAIANDVFEEGDQAGLYINGVSVGTVTLQNDSSGTLDADKAKADTIDAINQKSGETGVRAIDNGVSITLEAADGRNISVAIDDKSGNSASIGSILGLDAAENGIGESTFGLGDTSNGTNAEARTYETTYGTVKLTSASSIDVSVGTNGKDELAALGLQSGTYGGGTDGTFLKDIDISTFQGAQDAIKAIDNALQTVSSQRAELGALQNRFESTVSNLEITSENLTAANSRIKDADFAAETAELSRTQVLQQAGISVLAQANQQPQQVLSLLG